MIKTKIKKRYLIAGLCYIICLTVSMYFYHDLIKKDLSFKLQIANEGLENILKKQNSIIALSTVMKNALPVLNKYKIEILRHPGYWPDIFNVYNQMAVVENLNGDRGAAIKLLLRSLHYHPHLSETYKALSLYLTKIGEDGTASSCRRFGEQLINGDEIDQSLKEICIKKAEEIIGYEAH